MKIMEKVFNEYSKDEQNKICLDVIKKAKQYIADKEANILIESVIEMIKDINNKENVSEKLYDYLDNEGNGFTILQEHETNNTIIAAWDAIIDAIAIICKNTYPSEKYLPEPLMMIDDNTAKHMMDSLSICEQKS